MEPWWSSDPPGEADGPGTYALVIGVSRYGNLPSQERWGMDMGQLSCAAITAAEFARWLRTTHHIPEAPLRAVWLLLSPSEVEAGKLTPDELAAPPATTAEALAAAKAWRDACRTDPGNVSFVYAAGHGLGITPGEPGVLLLEDYGDGGEDEILANAISLNRIHGNLAGSPDGAPGRQFMFVDACRPLPELAREFDLGQAPPAAWTIRTTPPTAQSCPIYLSAAHGTLAYGPPGEGTVFWQVLKSCLEGFAADLLDGHEDRFVIRDDTLYSALLPRVRDLAAAGEREQVPDSTAKASGCALHVFREPPRLARTFAADPETAGDVAYATLSHRLPPPAEFSDVPLAVPYSHEVPAGNYLLSVSIRPPTSPYVDNLVPQYIHPRGPETISVPVTEGMERRK